MHERMTFSIVVPVYQNEENLHDTVPKLLDLQGKVPSYSLELIFVEDGSTDGSFKILVDYARKHPQTIKIVKLTRNFGQNMAIRAGLCHAGGGCVGIISADLQEPHETFIEMVKAWERGAPWVIGARQKREERLWHQVVSGMYWRMVGKFAFPDFPPMGYDFCLLSRKIVDEINTIKEKNVPLFVLIYWLGYKPVVVPITRKLRRHGKSQWKLRDKVRLTVDTLIGFTYLPTRFISFLGIALAGLTLVYLTVMLILWFWWRAAPPGWMSILATISLVGSAILFSLGIISEYLLRILDETRKRPLYIVERLINVDGQNQGTPGEELYVKVDRSQS